MIVAHRSTRPNVRHASLLADEILLRAKRQAQHRLGDMEWYVVETGLPALDAVVNRCPGVSLFLGLEDRARTALATQIAFETARAGKPVLWLCAGGHRDLALLMIMTRLADLELGRVFVKRDLRHPEWRRLEAAAFAVSKLPLRFADAHGANAVQLEDAFCRSITETRVEHQLVTDHLDAPLKPILPHLEQLSEVVRVPVFVLLDVDGPFGRPLSVYETGARLRAFGVDGYISRRRSEGAADTTISKELVVLRKSLRLAIRAGLWRGRVDEVIPVAFSPGYEPRERALTAEELKKLLTELLPDRAACVAFIVATSACWRETELARRADVGEGLATVLLRGTKRKTRFRTVPIVSPAQQSLLAYALEHALMARAMGLAPPHPGPLPRLVPGERGGRLRCAGGRSSDHGIGRIRWTGWTGGPLG